MFGLAIEIESRVKEWAANWVNDEIQYEGMPLEYAYLMEKRVYNNLMSDLKHIL